jgi:hypothetical protein
LGEFVKGGACRLETLKLVSLIAVSENVSKKAESRESGKTDEKNSFQESLLPPQAGVDERWLMRWSREQ